MSAWLLIKPQEPHPAKATLCLPSPLAGRGWGWGAMIVEIITNYPDMILLIPYVVNQAENYCNPQRLS